MKTSFRHMKSVSIVVSIIFAVFISGCGGGGGAPAAASNSISGKVVGANGVVINLTGAAIANTTSGASGDYKFPVVSNGLSTVTPSKTGFIFTPTSVAESMRGPAIAGVNFEATANAAQTYCLTGTVNGAVVAGVMITLNGDNNGATWTDASGNYGFCGLVRGQYAATAALPGYAFTPPNIIVIGAAGSSASNNFTSAVPPSGGSIVFVKAVLPPAVVGIRYNHTVIQSIAGGTPPYHYVSDTFANGAPPLGMIIDLNGNLTGIPTIAGEYTFGVCAVDSVGLTTTKCDPSITVYPALAVSLAGTGNGTVTSTTAGISCGATCTAGFASGSSVTLTATPATGSTFTGWSGACSGTGSCVVKMSGNKVAVTATFATSVGNTCSNGATNYPTCTPPTSGTYYWANWSCGASTQCASVMGASNGSTGQFCTLADCNACTTSGCIGIFNASCATTATYAKHTVTAVNGICLQSGVDF